MSPKRAVRPLAAVSFAVATLLLAACGSSRSPRSEPTTTSIDASSTSTGDSVPASTDAPRVTAGTSDVTAIPLNGSTTVGPSRVGSSTTSKLTTPPTSARTTTTATAGATATTAATGSTT